MPLKKRKHRASTPVHAQKGLTLGSAHKAHKMENASSHEEEPQDQGEHRKSEGSFWTTVIVWFGSSLLLYLFLEVLALFGLHRATVSHWNEESMRALASYQLFEWWECAPQGLGYQCNSSPLTYLLNNGSLFELGIKTLQLMSGIALLLWILGVKTTLRRSVLITLPLMLVFVMILFAIPFAIGAVLGLLNVAMYFIGLGDQLRSLALSLLSLLALPFVLPVALITMPCLRRRHLPRSPF